MERFSIARSPGRFTKAPRRTVRPGEVWVDRQTFRDLEIFEAQEGRPGLFRLLDRARTRGGASALFGRFLAPLSEPDRIRAVQGSLRYILAHRAEFASLPGQYLVSGFEHYFHGNLPAPASANRFGLALDALQLFLESFRQLQQIARGARHTARLLRGLRQVATHPGASEAPGEVGAHLREIRDILGRPALASLPLEREERWRVFRVLAVDRVFRHGEKESVERLVRILFEIDALVSLADATDEYAFVFPEVVDGELEIVADGVYHPLVGAPVPNPLHVDAHHRLLFLTGPNMAGKTTYLRACATAIYLAHLGMGVPARSFRFSPCEAIFTAITLADNVRTGISFFEAEALRARAIAQAVADGRRVVAVMDEPFKGTNVKDALDASCAFLTRLVAREGSVFLVSSHLIEAGPTLQATGHVDCRRFEATETDGRLEFDYVLRPGLSSQRLGMRVLREKGVFALLDGSGRAPAGPWRNTDTG
ncbi:MAG TPA: hypothetical protein VFQ38_12335 [Longimicrobiales bacterium]|nr:hypothetical protein [Longimicrobiales bacterium]